MDFAHGGELGVTLPDKVLELDGNHVFEIYLGVEGCLVIATPPYLDGLQVDAFYSDCRV